MAHRTNEWIILVLVILTVLVAIVKFTPQFDFNFMTGLGNPCKGLVMADCGNNGSK